MRIRDHMDDILEARGYYRKHVAHDDNSVFRAVADIKFHTQQHTADMLKYCLGVYRQHRDNDVTDDEDQDDDEADQDRDGDEDDVDGQVDQDGDHQAKKLTPARPWTTSPRSHSDLRDLVNLLGVPVDLVDTANADINVLRIYPRGTDGKKPKETTRPLLASAHCMPKNYSRLRTTGRNTKADSKEGEGGDGDGVVDADAGVRGSEESSSSRSQRTLLLCFSGPRQYDPVYPKYTIDNAALVQSVLYEALYVSVFGVTDAMQAADVMLNGNFNPIMGKPEVYNKDFVGTAMEALENFLIPFPYKVAKALDAELYRNIEYDVWANEKRSSTSSSVSGSPRKDGSGRSGGGSPGPPQTIGNLSQGTPCLIRYPTYGEIYGMVLQPTRDRMHMEVYLPHFDMFAYVPRKCILPIRPDGLAWFPSALNEMALATQMRGALQMNQGPPELCYSPPPSYHPVPLMHQPPPAIAHQQDVVPRASSPSPVATPAAEGHNLQEQQVRNNNLKLLAREDPGWLEKSDFSVPPPPFFPVGPPLVTESESQAVAPTTAFRHVAAATSAVAVTSPAAVAGMAVASAPGTEMHPQSPIEDPAILRVYSVDQNGNYTFGAVASQSPFLPPGLGFPYGVSSPVPPQSYQDPSVQAPVFSPFPSYAPADTPMYQMPSPAVFAYPSTPYSGTPYPGSVQVFQFPSPPSSPSPFVAVEGGMGASYQQSTGN